MDKGDKENAWAILVGLILIGVALYGFSKGWWLPSGLVLAFGAAIGGGGTYRFLTK